MIAYKGNQRGSAMANLIVFAGLWLLTTFLFFIFYGAQNIYEREVQVHKNKIKQLKNHQRDVEKRLQEIESLTGFYREGSENRAYLKEAVVDIRRLMDNLNKINSKDKEPGTREYYGLTTLVAPDVEIAEDKLTTTEYLVNVENVINAFKDRIYQLQREQQNLEYALKKVISDKANKNSEREQVVRKQKEVLDDLERQRKVLVKKLQAQLDNVKKQIRKAEEAKALALKESKKLDKKIQSQKLEFENLISKKKNEIRKIQATKYGRTVYSEITKQKKFNSAGEKSDGSVIFADPRSRTVYLSLGRLDNMIRGLKFDVYRYAKKGTQVFKGRVEIQKVMDKVSMAILIEQVSDLDPIVNGDYVVNPVFLRNGTVHFAFAGNFINISNNRVKKLIAQLGAKVEDNVTARTNYVVVGDKGEDHPNYLSAVSFGIPLMTEKVLLRYIGD